jgi:hypothetical protein
LEKRGNKFLEYVFEQAHSGNRSEVPLVLVFTKVTESGRVVAFHGVAVPGAFGVPTTDDLVAIWKTSNVGRFQNYRALFTILDIECAPREWLSSLQQGLPTENLAPTAWYKWVRDGSYHPLVAPRVRKWRTKEEQTAASAVEQSFIRKVHEHYAQNPFAFKKFAAMIVGLSDPRSSEWEITRAWRDGGRDALGTYHIGPLGSGVEVECALEAKGYEPGRGVGV